MTTAMICPSCRAGYAPDARVCEPCQTQLEPQERLSITEDERTRFEQEWLRLRRAPLPWIEELSQALRDANIEHRVAASADLPGQGEVFVGPDDGEAAGEIDTRVLRAQLPDVPDDFDPLALADDRCPACSGQVSETDTECPECGLAIGPV